MHSTELVFARNMNIYQIKAKNTLFFNNKITPNLILARRAWFWHVASFWSLNTADQSKHKKICHYLERMKTEIYNV